MAICVSLISRRGFGHAARGLHMMVRQEANARFHLIATMAVIGAGAMCRLALDEWRWVTVGCAIVWSAEAFNTAIERLSDCVCATHDPLIGVAKDLAAAAVLSAAIGALVIGALTFLPHIAGALR